MPSDKDPLIDIDIEFEWYDVEVVTTKLEDFFTKVIHGMVHEIFYEILNRTPQATGAYAASWSLSVGSPLVVDRTSMVKTYSFDTLPKSGYLKQKGDHEAIEIALSASVGALTYHGLGQDIYITNGVLNEMGYHYAPDIEAEKVVLRAVNRPGNALARALDQAGIRYEDISTYAASRLSGVTL